MRRRLARAAALPLAAALVVLPAAPAAGQVTTPIPPPADPNNPPASEEVLPRGKAIGEAGTALGMVRLLPELVPTSSIMPGADEVLPRQSALEGGFGLSSAQANSESYLTYERSIASASPAGIAIGGNAPTSPGTATQTALPDNEEPVSTGLNAPDNPLINVSALNGTAHARWSEDRGPCVGTISDASTSTASVSLLNTIPTMPDVADLTDADASARGALDRLGSLANLGGLLSGQRTDDARPAADGTGSLISAPNTLSTRSTVRLVDMPDTERKAVESTSTMQAADVNILKGTPLGFTVKVASQPTLRVLSTGSAETSKVEYTAPVLTIERNGQELFKLDAANPTADVPVGLPTDELKNMPGYEQVKDVPVIGDAAELASGGVKTLSDAAANRVLDLGVLRLSIAELTERGADRTEPFEGHQLGASARLLDLQILPTERLKNLLPDDAADRLPASLAQVSLGEQIARAYAPKGGVDCSVPEEPAPPQGGGAAPPAAPEKLAQTSGAYASVPIFWSGTAMLLVGAVLVAVAPGRRGGLTGASTTPKPSPHPRE
ncbi:hypothetical protein BJF85_12790 [Saccharomonospora sp. CUA-673]|uniref:hypothetical protein n=1 Tax=Saccharomonospora sp. CUA-673 TaxID=1904969 RepID=UPI00095A53B0|nr:hypothetical protein [Saccharomonospora sp. CUA-673]OLT48391.1 hypothetical protein BJF85_12790 [Saccharomonospora sp. CUA-673]